MQNKYVAHAHSNYSHLVRVLKIRYRNGGVELCFGSFHTIHTHRVESEESVQLRSVSSEQFRSRPTQSRPGADFLQSCRLVARHQTAHDHVFQKHQLKNRQYRLIVHNWKSQETRETLEVVCTDETRDIHRCLLFNLSIWVRALSVYLWALSMYPACMECITVTKYTSTYRCSLGIHRNMSPTHDPHTAEKVQESRERGRNSETRRKRRESVTFVGRPSRRHDRLDALL